MEALGFGQPSELAPGEANNNETKTLIMKICVLLLAQFNTNGSLPGWRFVMPFASKKTLSGKELMVETFTQIHRTRKQEAKLLAQLTEIGHRKLFAPESDSSMFQFCMGHLHLF